MTFIPVAFDEAVEPKPLAAGRYPVVIQAAQVGETGPNSKNPGSPQLIFTCNFVGSSLEEQTAPSVRHYMGLPNQHDDARTARGKALALKRFLTVFGIPYANDGIDTEEIVFQAIGHEAELDVELSEPDSNGNVYNRLKIPRMND